MQSGAPPSGPTRVVLTAISGGRTTTITLKMRKPRPQDLKSTARSYSRAGLRCGQWASEALGGPARHTASQQLRLAKSPCSSWEPGSKRGKPPSVAPALRPSARRRGLTEASSSQPASDNSATGVANFPSSQLRPVGPADGFYSLSWSQHDKENEVSYRTPFNTSSWVSRLRGARRKEKSLPPTPRLELIHRTRAWAANMLVLRKAVLKRN